MAYDPIGFWDRRNPMFGGGQVKPMGYDPRRGATGSWDAPPEAPTGNLPLPPGGFANANAEYLNSTVGQLMESSRLRADGTPANTPNPAVSTTPKTPRPAGAAPAAPDTPDGTPPGHPSYHEPSVPSVPVSGATPGMTGASPVNAFGMTAEQVQAREEQRAALQKWRMGLATTGYPLSEANQLQDFGKSFQTPALPGTAGKINSALAGGAEGYLAGRAMRERKLIAEQIKQLRDAYQNDRNRAGYASTAREAQRGAGETSGVDLSDWDPAAEMDAREAGGAAEAFDMADYDMSRNSPEDDYWKMNWGM